MSIKESGKKSRRKKLQKKTTSATTQDWYDGFAPEPLPSIVVAEDLRAACIYNRSYGMVHKGDSDSLDHDAWLHCGGDFRVPNVRDQAKLERKPARLAQVEAFENAGAFVKCLADCDVPYFTWWMSQQGRDCHYLSILNVEAVVLQYSLLEMHKRFKIFCTERIELSHCVFKGVGCCYVAVDRNVLYAYRLMSLNFIVRMDVNVGNSYSLVPPLIRAWAASSGPGEEPVQPFVTMAVAKHVLWCLGHDARSLKSLYQANEPGFAIYKNLPTFFLLWCDDDFDEKKIQAFAAKSFLLREQYVAMSMYNCFDAFLFQNKPHLIHSRSVYKLRTLLNNEDALKMKYPVASAILNYLWDHSPRDNGNYWHPISDTLLWNKLNLSQDVIELLHSDVPRVYFLYQLCFEERIYLNTRQELARSIILEEHANVSNSPRFDFQMQRDWTEQPSLAQSEMKYYESIFVPDHQFQEQQQQQTLAVIPSIKRDHVRALYCVLKTMDFVAREKECTDFGNDSLFIQDIVEYATQCYARGSFPLARVGTKRSLDTVQFERCLWVFPSSVSANPEKLEAFFLIRSGDFYNLRVQPESET
jgi:hypothetical protein